MEGSNWIGVWSGSDGEVSTRVEIDAVQDGSALRIHSEVSEPGLGRLRHGLRAVLSRAPNGSLRAIAYSSLHNSLLMDRLPDDEGALALAGVADCGTQLFLTMVQQGDETLLFTCYSRAPGQPQATYTTARLARLG